MLRAVLTAAVLLVPGSVLLPGQGDAYPADNGLRVFPTDEGAVVRSMGGAAAREFFCAAADWAVHTQGLPRGASIVLTRDVAPDPAFDGARTAYFAFGADGRGTGLIVRPLAGESMSAAHALLICDQEGLFVD
ncbi:hypothetical protein BCF33_0321 [Hasllibacter halocynthiae]|uniref:Uncharacterized protein n=1 Tax=Hasllibacter halocynthiae TaxID=595589 RepID=A0A2T0X757_9RHOB|nr:hypothetical protein [Hasllibacter halocynthiae]PRY94725.1 hypothetical protein BCF33_0321 [Hasllibacter halocynthiae]